VINDILDFSKLEARRLQIEAVDFSPEQVIDGVVSLLAARAREKGVALTAAISDAVPPWLTGDPNRIRQVLLNLVGNAIKFTERGSVRISAGAAPRADGGVDLTVEVADSGIGMAEEVMARLFTPFTQADSSTARRYGGTGLGLAICKELCTLMGGTIDVDSAPGRGSRFRFTLPCGTGRPPEAAPAPAAEPAPPSALRILVAEDNAINQRLIGTILQRLGHTAEIVANGAEAVSAVGRHRYDLVLMDVQMPVMDGLEAAQAIRALPGEAGRVPILALTANAFAEQRAQCLDAGMNDCLTKPIQPAALVEALTHWGAQRDGEAEAEPASALNEANPLSFMADDLSPAATRELAHAFMADAAERVVRLAEHVARADWPALGHEAHDIAGTLGNVGAHRVVELARQLERACKTEPGQPIAPIVEALERAVHQALRALAERYGPLAA